MIHHVAIMTNPAEAGYLVTAWCIRLCRTSHTIHRVAVEAWRILKSQVLTGVLAHQAFFRFLGIINRCNSVRTEEGGFGDFRRCGSDVMYISRIWRRSVVDTFTIARLHEKHVDMQTAMRISCHEEQISPWRRQLWKIWMWQHKWGSNIV